MRISLSIAKMETTEIPYGSTSAQASPEGSLNDKYTIIIVTSTTN